MIIHLIMTKKCRYYSDYIHIKDPQVKKNQWVRKGDIIAYSYGTDTLDHLHFEIQHSSVFQLLDCSLLCL